jgi:hypothetical protein
MPAAFSTELIAPLMNAKQDLSVICYLTPWLGKPPFFTPGGADFTELNINLIPKSRISLT